MESGRFYHIYNRGINKQNIFFEDENYLFFLDRFKKYICDKIEIYAYCLMPNHFHLFIKVKEHVSEEKKSNLTVLEKSFKDFFISYSKAINKRYSRTGALFQYKFKRKEIASDAYFTWLIYYIHANPIKAGLTNSLASWKYSSYKAILSNNITLINRSEVLKWFGGRKEFESFHVINRNTIQDQLKIEEYLKLD